MARRSIRSTSVAWSEVRVGVILIVALLVLAYAIYRVGDLFDVFADRYPLITLLPRADGLLEGAPVTLAGQRVGQVKSIEFLPVGFADRNHLSIRLDINEEVQPYIRTDSRARVRTQGLLGDKFIDISLGSPDAPVLQPWDTIPGIGPIDMEQFFATADSVLIEAKVALENLQRITGTLLAGEGTLGRLLTDEELYERVAATARELEMILAEARTGDGTLGRLIHDPALYERLVGAAERVDSLAALILEGDGSLGRLLRSDEFYERLLAVVGRADTTIATIGGTVEAMISGEGALRRLLTDPALYDQFLKAVIDLQILINEIREDPRRIRPEIKIDIF